MNGVEDVQHLIREVTSTRKKDTGNEILESSIAEIKSELIEKME